VFFKNNKELKFKKIRVICGGTPYEEDMEEEGQAEPQTEGAAGGLQELVRRAKSADEKWKQTRETVQDQIASLRRELDAFDDPDVQSIRERLSSALDKYPRLDLASLAGANDPVDFGSRLEKTRGTVAEWRKLLAADAALRAMDENPFGVDVSIVDTYGDALDSIATELKL
jgi:hypothetical protein